MSPRLRVATRGSDLARHQTDVVVARLGVDAEVVVITTTGEIGRASCRERVSECV